MNRTRTARVQRYTQALNIERTYPVEQLPNGSILWETALLDGSYVWTVERPDGSLTEVVR